MCKVLTSLRSRKKGGYLNSIYMVNLLLPTYTPCVRFESQPMTEGGIGDGVGFKSVVLRWTWRLFEETEDGSVDGRVQRRNVDELSPCREVSSGPDYSSSVYKHGSI